MSSKNSFPQPGSELQRDDRTISIVITRQHIALIDNIVRAVEQYATEWWQKTPLPGVRVDRRARLRFPAGLVADVVRVLNKDGYQAKICDRRRDRFSAYTRAIEQAEGPDRRFLEAVAHNPLGIVEVSDDEELVTRVAQLAGLYPGVQIVLAVATRRLAWRLWRELRELVKHAVGLVTAKTRRPGGNLVVCTYKTLVRLHDRDQAILVVAEAERAIHTVAKYTSGSLAYARVYGFVYAHVSRDEAADLQLTALAGEVIHAVPATTAPARVLMAATPPLPGFKAGRQGLQQRRRTVWENRVRNRLVARVALAVRDGDLDALHECGLNFGAEELGGKDRRVAVLVESTAHAKELQSLLRGWPTLSRVPPDLRRPDSEANADCTNPTGVIVTLMYAALEELDADVVVRATGGRGEWVAGGFPAKWHEPPRPAPLVIDFADAFDEQARKDTQWRVSDYRRRGWPVEGIFGLK